MLTTIETSSPVASDTLSAPLHAQGATNSPALTPIHWWSHCNESIGGVERHTDLAPIAAAFYTGEARAVIKAACGRTNNGYIGRAWSLAMTAVYGPVGTHESQGEHPEVIKAKARALADLRGYLSV